ncbi:MAG: hypothetical protein ACN6NT_09810, partial [Comamonas sp.]
MAKGMLIAMRRNFVQFTSNPPTDWQFGADIAHNQAALRQGYRCVPLTFVLRNLERLEMHLTIGKRLR